MNYLRSSFLAKAHIHILHSIVTEAGNWLHVVEVGHVLIIVSKSLELALVLVLGQESFRPRRHHIRPLKSLELMDVFISIVILEFWLVSILVIGRVASLMVRSSPVAIVVSAIVIALVVISSLVPVVLLPVAVVLPSTSGISLSVALVVVVVSPIVAILVVI